MRIDVVGRGVEVTDAIRQHSESKAAKLTKYFDGVQQITITLTRADHHHHGDFDVELLLEVVKHDPFVAHAKGHDVYAAVDQVVQKATRQLTDFKEKLRLGNR